MTQKKKQKKRAENKKNNPTKDQTMTKSRQND